MPNRRGRTSKMGARLTGLDFFGFGASWEPAISDAAVAESLVRYLEDRRVLYASADVEIAEHCIESVLDIRRRITDALARGGLDQTLTDSLRAMRTSCRTFLDRLRIDPNADEFQIVHRYRDDRARGFGTGLNDWVLNQAIGELRGVFGIHIALLAGRYGIVVEDSLATILPAEPEA